MRHKSRKKEAEEKRETERERGKGEDKMRESEIYWQIVPEGSF